MKRVVGLITTFVFLIIKAGQWIFKYVFGGIIDVCMFFGLEVPLLYIIFGAVLRSNFGLDISEQSSSRTLFYLGFWLCLIVALVILIRHIVDAKRETTSRMFRKVHPKKRKKRVLYPQKIEKPIRTQSLIKRDEKPRVYRSQMYPELLIHEYSDRFKVYDYETRELVRVEYKN